MGDALLLLLECEELHSQPVQLWDQCVRWAYLRKGQESSSLTEPRPPGPDSAKPPRKMFVPGARLVAISAPQPVNQEVAWQAALLPVAERTRFIDMPAGAFAAHMEAINPMLPELRQVIYRIRRQGVKES